MIWLLLALSSQISHGSSSLTMGVMCSYAVSKLPYHYLARYVKFLFRCSFNSLSRPHPQHQMGVIVGETGNGDDQLDNAGSRHLFSSVLLMFLETAAAENGGSEIRTAVRTMRCRRHCARQSNYGYSENPAPNEFIDWYCGRVVAAMFVEMAFCSPIYERLRVLGFNNVFEVNFWDKRTRRTALRQQRAYMWDGMKDWLLTARSRPTKRWRRICRARAIHQPEQPVGAGRQGGYAESRPGVSRRWRRARADLCAGGATGGEGRARRRRRVRREGRARPVRRPGAWMR